MFCSVLRQSLGALRLDRFPKGPADALSVHLPVRFAKKKALQHKNFLGISH
jgi:hypothetical protein